MLPRLLSIVTLFGVCYGLGGVLVVGGVGVDRSAISGWSDKLHSSGFPVEFISVESDQLNPTLANQEYNTLVLLAVNSNKLNGLLSPSSIMSRITAGSNVVIALDHQSVGPNHSKLGQHLNIIQPNSPHKVIDHFNSINPDSVIPTLNPEISPILNSNEVNESSQLSFSGIGHSLNRSPLVIPLCYGSPSAYSASLPDQTGSHISLVSAVQLKENQRIIWSGSLDLFTGGENSEFVGQVMEWVTHQSGVVAIESVTHSRVEDNQSLPIYKVNDQLRYTINFKPGHSIPFDGQVEFVMLDPYLRLPLLAQPDQPNSLSATFRAPDQHGVFTFSFDYRRAGYSSISHKTTVSIAPPRHDQFDRFITGAGPFYLGAGSVALATLSLIAIWSSA